jgi:hypothetical protein
MFNPISKEQQKFINNYSSYNGASEGAIGSMHNYDTCMTNATPILKKTDFSYKNNTIVENLSDTLNRETIIEYRLNIDSGDRDVDIYPDPFQYVVTFGPVVNSNITSVIQRDELKTNLRNQNSYNNRNKNRNQKVVDSFEDNELLYSLENDLLVNYDNTLKKIFNPYITRDFINVKFIRLDNIVLPRYNALKINYDWKYTTKKNNCVKYIKDDYERLIDCSISYERYIPDPNICLTLLTDRFIMVSIKEIRNNQNLATNIINTNSFTVFPDKPTGLMYWRGNPYYAVRIYDDSLLGNITKLSFEFYGSDGTQIKLDTSQVSYEISFINSVNLINPNNTLMILNDYHHDHHPHDHHDHHGHHHHHDHQCRNQKIRFILDKITQIIKCIIIINFDIKDKIKFYSDVPSNKDCDCSSNKDCECSSNKDCDCSSNKDCECSSNKDCYKEKELKYNDCTFVLGDMFCEFNEFVTTNGFINVCKKTQDGKKVSVSVDQYIYNVLWYISINDACNENYEINCNAYNNLKIILERYKEYVFAILDKLKKEIANLPLNKYFQNHSLFTMGVYEQKLNTKINYRP